MRLFAISLRNLRVRAVSTTLTTVSIMLGTALLAALWLLIDQTRQRYRSSAAGFEAVVGPKDGAPLALVLNTVYHLGNTTGIVPFSVYKQLRERRELRYAIPQARGDTYLGFPVIGTTDEMFTKFRRGDYGELQFAAGRRFKFTHDEFVQFAGDLAAGKIKIEHHDHAHGHDHAEHDAAHTHDSPWHEAVIGAQVAQRGALALGDWIAPVHGAENDPDPHVHEESKCRIVGILEPTRTPLDAAIFIPLSTFLTMDKHDDAVRTTNGESQVALKAIIVDSVHHLGASWLRREFQTRSDAQVAWTAIEISELLSLVGSATDVLYVVSWMVLLVAAVSIAVALYNTMNERRREIAIMRALGARRAQILSIVLLEATVIALVGGALGVLVCHLGIWALADVIHARTGIFVDAAAFTWPEVGLIVGVGVLGGLAGVLPATKGSRTQVADNLAPTS